MMLQEHDKNKNTSVVKDTSETQKLYRHAQQLSHRLDAKLVSAFEWKDLFDPETLAFRQKLRDVCETLLFSASHEIARKAEEYLWRKVYYDIIQRVRQDKKALMKDDGLLAAYDTHLVGAIGFYNQLLMRLNHRFKIPLQGTVDWSLDSSNLGSIGENGKHSGIEEVSEERINWSLKACQRCLIYLGDLSRYHYDVFEGHCPDLAERHYYMAVIMNPSFGMPHNQLGTLRQGIGYGCETVYHYMRCLLSPMSFEGAEENLKRMLEKHRQLMQQMSRDRKLEKLADKDAFLCFFLKVQEHFCGYSNVSMDEITHTGHQALYSFSLMLESAYSEFQKTSDSNNTFPAQAVSAQCMVKLICICIMNTCELKRKGIQLCTVALSFLIALATKMLEQAVKILKCLMHHISGQVVTERSNDNTPADLGKSPEEEQKSPVAEKVDPSPDEKLRQLKKKVLRSKKRRRRRRRGRRLTNSEDDEDSSEDEAVGHGADQNLCLSDEETVSDLSEGELDASLSSDESSSSGSESSLLDDSCLSHSTEELESAVEIEQEHVTNEVSESEKQCLVELGAAAVKLGNDDTKSQRKKQKFTAWEAAMKTPGTEHLYEKAIKDIHFPHMLHNYCYLPVIKVFFDWLKCCYKEFDFEDVVNRPLWSAVSEFLNILPPKELYIVAASHKKRLQDALTAIANRGSDNSKQRALPEDMLVFGMTSLAEAQENLDFSWAQNATHAHLFQCIVRDKCIRDFVEFVSTIEGPFLTVDHENRKLVMKETSSQDQARTPTKKLASSPTNTPSSGKKTDSKSKSKEFMKALAKQKLEYDVSQLETTLEATKISNSNLSAYLVMETQALCRHLSLIRSLLKSREFIIVIPKQVIAALDDLKKYNPGAREAIKFLEEEFRLGNRWLKSQDDAEAINEDILAQGQKKTKSFSVDDWRFFQIVRCACYFGRQCKAERLVSILTSDQFQQNGLGHSAIRLFPQVVDFCQENNVQLQSTVSFYKRWTSVRK